MKLLKKILIITPFFAPNIGGVETRFTAICDYLRNNGHYVYVLTYQPLTVKAKGLPFEKKENLEISRFPWIGKNLFHKLLIYPFLEFFYLVPLLFFISLYFIFIRRKNIDVIHTPGLNASMIGVCLKIITKKRLVISMHTVYGIRKDRWFLRKIASSVLNKADKVVAISRRSREELLDWGVKENKIIIHTTWVDHEIFKPLDKIECRKILNWEQNKFIILFVGRLFRHKGIDLIIKTAIDFGRKYKDIIFVIIGAGDEEEKIYRAARSLDNLRFLGYVPNEKLPPYYSASDVFIMPTYDIEPFGRVAAEALSCGLPVLARENSGFLDIADLSVSRPISPDISSISKEILSLYNDRKTLYSMSVSASEFAKKHFGENNIKTLLKSYEI